MKEKPPDGSKRIDDPKMARAMADASDQLRTLASRGRSYIGDLETPDGVHGKIFTFLRNKIAFQGQLQQIQKNVLDADKEADLLEDIERVKYQAQEKAKNLSDEELEKLAMDTFLSLPRDVLEGRREEEEWDKETTESTWFLGELYRILEHRKPMN